MTCTLWITGGCNVIINRTTFYVRCQLQRQLPCAARKLRWYFYGANLHIFSWLPVICWCCYSQREWGGRTERLTEKMAELCIVADLKWNMTAFDNVETTGERCTRESKDWRGGERRHVERPKERWFECGNNDLNVLGIFAEWPREPGWCSAGIHACTATVVKWRVKRIKRW